MAIISRPDVAPIPENITVHLGAPDAAAENITVPFPEYIKNVASGTLNPTWPDAALLANIYAQISLALNRIQTESYRDKGYLFDLTNHEPYEQNFVPGRDIYENISRIVDENFDSYIVRSGSKAAAFTPYCDGVETTCEGLSQWGSVELAKQGKKPYEILTFYYGEDIDLVRDIPIDANFESYPRYPLRVGSSGREVGIIQHEINRIAENYPVIPRIQNPDGNFTREMEASIKAFQRIFRLPEDGVVGKSTWYKIKYVYDSVKGLGELFSGRVGSGDFKRPADASWKEGDSGIWVMLIQYYMRSLSCYYHILPLVEISGTFGPETSEAAKALVSIYGLPWNGLIDADVLARFYQDYLVKLKNIPEDCLPEEPVYPGYLLYRGMGDNNVRLIQGYLRGIAEKDPDIPMVSVTGVFDAVTEAAVSAFDSKYLGEGQGDVLIGPITWSAIISVYHQLQ
ncbi:peptidoglycan-binding protein [Anoxybacterium hadale]|uniref:peptidoglycan-binding domain-containing protein n=1 Tax=Anoxybacterium hadale TaxID=3408580 RepID=UPI003B0046AC